MTEHLTDVDRLRLWRLRVERYGGMQLTKPESLAMFDLIDRLRTALTGISTCSTCEACRGAARLALGERTVAEINAAVDERLDRVEHELAEFAPPADPGPSEADHPKNDWQCAVCTWMNFGSRTSCGHCETARPSQPPATVWPEGMKTWRTYPDGPRGLAPTSTWKPPGAE